MQKAALVLIAVSSLLGPLALHAQEATAGLSSPSTYVGRPVEIVVTVRDARSAEVPERVNVPGLEIQLFGRSTRFEMNNFKITSSLTYTYSVIPRQVGEFEIPPFNVRVGNKTLRTNPLRLNVADASQLPAPMLPPVPSQQQSSPRSMPSPGGGLPYFGDLVLSKKKAYVGEVIPTELRYYFQTSIGGEVGDRPNFTGEGFTVQSLVNIPKREQIVNGENYVVFAFQTAVTPAKAGKIEIPSAPLEARLQLPGSPPAGFDDFFRHFGGMPPGMFTNAQQVAVETRPTQLDVAPLPKDGLPDDFSGAIGKFKMEAMVSPKKAGPGDPVTLRVVITGQGNFEAMGAPVLTGEEEWHTYPPAEKFRASDSINFSGEKVYEFMLVARSDQNKTPSVRFSYFDPSTGKYELLTAAPLEVEARAGKPQSAPVDELVDKKTVAAPVSTPTPVAVAATQAGGASDWTPLLRNPAFITSNAALGILWLLTLAGLVIRRLLTSPAGLRRKRRQRLGALLTAAQHCPDEEFVSQAATCLHAALDTKSSPLDASARIDSLALDPGTKRTLHDLLAREAESKYSTTGTKAPDREQRSAIIEALKKVAL